jgi:hypothetical protein
VARRKKNDQPKFLANKLDYINSQQLKMMLRVNGIGRIWMIPSNHITSHTWGDARTYTIKVKERDFDLAQLVYEDYLLELKRDDILATLEE